MRLIWKKGIELGGQLVRRWSLLGVEAPLRLRLEGGECCLTGLLAGKCGVNAICAKGAVLTISQFTETMCENVILITRGCY